jgi:enoyl-CoA hydratase
VGPSLAKRLLFTGDTISGDEAFDHGLATSAHPAEELDAAALDLASRIARSSRDMLMSNKRVLNMGIELWGRTTLQRFAQAEDALAHLSPDAVEFRDRAREGGLTTAFRARDEPFAG